jgi:GTP cyclohydrolase I
MPNKDDEVGLATTGILKSKGTGISDIIRSRLIEKKRRFFANDNVADFIESDDEKQALIEEVSQKFEAVLRALLIDTDNDPNSKDTGRRFAKMYINEIYAGRFTPPPKVTSFPNEKLNPQGTNGDNTRPDYSFTGLLVVPVDLNSVCSHHMQNVTGIAYIGIIPGESVIGLSKYVRIAQHQAQRGTLQEQLTEDILKAIQKAAKTRDVAVVNFSTHGCMACRGVHAQNSHVSTAELSGLFLASSELREEFYRHINMLEDRRSHKG